MNTRLDILHRYRRGEIPLAEAADEELIRDLIESAPEPLKKLGEFLADKLQDDDWNNAEPYLLALAAFCAPSSAEVVIERLESLKDKFPPQEYSRPGASDKEFEDEEQDREFTRREIDCVIALVRRLPPTASGNGLSEEERHYVEAYRRQNDSMRLVAIIERLTAAPAQTSAPISRDTLIELAFRASINNSDNWRESFNRHSTVLSEEGGSPLYRQAVRLADEYAGGAA